MDAVEIYTQHIHYMQKFTLIIFLLLVSFYYRFKIKDFHKSKTRENEDYNIFSELLKQLMDYGSKLYLLLFPLMLVFLEYNVSFYLFVTLLLSFYTCFFIGASILFLWKNGYKLWEMIEGWF